MISASRFGYVIKILAALAISVSLFWLWQVLSPILDSSDNSQSDFLFDMFLLVFMGLPAFFGLYFGCKGICKTDPATIKGLVGSYCFALAYVLAVFLGDSTSTVSGLSDDLTHGLVHFLSAIVSIGVYLVASRRLLRLLGHQCPPVRQSLPTWPIGLVAFLLWLATMRMIMAIFPIRPEDFGMQLVLFIGAILLTVGIFKLGVWLFVKQKTTAQPADPSGS